MLLSHLSFTFTQSLKCNVVVKRWCDATCLLKLRLLQTLIKEMLWKSSGSYLTVGFDGFERAGAWCITVGKATLHQQGAGKVMHVWKLHGGSHCSLLWLEVRPFHQLTTFIFLVLHSLEPTFCSVAGTSEVNFLNSIGSIAYWPHFWSQAALSVAGCLCIVHVHTSHGLTHHPSIKMWTLGLLKMSKKEGKA